MHCLGKDLRLSDIATIGVTLNARVKRQTIVNDNEWNRSFQIFESAAGPVSCCLLEKVYINKGLCVKWFGLQTDCEYRMLVFPFTLTPDKSPISKVALMSTFSGPLLQLKVDADESR